MLIIPDYAPDLLADTAPCRGCGRETPYVLLDAKPPPGADPETADWTELFCQSCYGPGWLPV